VGDCLEEKCRAACRDWHLPFYVFSIVVDMRNMTNAHFRRYFGEEGMERMTRAREERKTNYLK
jgi:hypothetical protein